MGEMEAHEAWVGEARMRASSAVEEAPFPSLHSRTSEMEGEGRTAAAAGGGVVAMRRDCIQHLLLSKSLSQPLTGWVERVLLLSEARRRCGDEWYEAVGLETLGPRMRLATRAEVERRGLSGKEAAVAATRPPSKN